MSVNTRTQEIATVLRTEILRNQYRTGERLPSERDLAARFNVTRGAIREVLKGIEQLGIIDIQPGGARIVAKENATLEILNYLLNLDGYPNPKLVDDYLQVFKMICAMSARHFIVTANDEQLAFITDIIAKMKKEPTNQTLMREGWTTFFEYFLKVNDNLVMRLITNGLKGQFLNENVESIPKPQIDEKKMRKVLNAMSRAVKNRDQNLMGESVELYFEWVRNVFTRAFSEMQLSQRKAVGS